MADFKNAIPYIKKSEAGLSRALTDTASKRPAPWSYNGKTGWHTNKGITYTAFVANATKGSYLPNSANFFSMPDNIWLAIYKIGYWNPMSGDNIKSQAMANAIVDYAFAFGEYGAKSRISKWLSSQYKIVANTSAQIATAVNKLTAKGDKNVFLNFMDHRKKAFIALKQPANEKGWLNRMDELTKQGLSLVTENKKSAAGGIILLGAAALLLYNRKRIAAAFNKKNKITI